MRLLPLLPVPLVMLVLGALRPAILTAGFASVRAFLVTAGVGVAGLLVLAAGWRRWRWRSVWAADAVVLLLIAAVVWPAFRVRTLVEEFPSVAVAATPPPSASALPSAVAVLLASGRLEGIDHHAQGTVALYRVGDALALRFEGVDVEGTPTPSVHLVEQGQRDPDGGRRLGGLKAERGSFSYSLPAPTEVADVLVWCDRYAVPIAAADLRPA